MRRIEKLLSLIPEKGDTVLDAGAREGYISIRLAEYFEHVTALDLEKPTVSHDRIHCAQGDITALEYGDNSFHTVVCSEVLEHIPSNKLLTACRELIRVSRKYLIIGVPYKQDLRVGRITCLTCKRPNPAWGHVNRFDESMLKNLFGGLSVDKIAYAGINDSKTNFLSVFLLDLAGNPYGDYTQQEVCIYCGSKFLPPPPRNLLQKIFTKIGVSLNLIQSRLCKSTPFWIIFLAKKP